MASILQLAAQAEDMGLAVRLHIEKSDLFGFEATAVDHADRVHELSVICQPIVGHGRIRDRFETLAHIDGRADGGHGADDFGIRAYLSDVDVSAALGRLAAVR